MPADGAVPSGPVGAGPGRRTHAVDTVTDETSLDRLHELLDGAWLSNPEVTGGDRMAFTTALAEVVANVVEHAAGQERVRLRLMVSVAEDRLEAVVEDRGRPYEGGAGAAGALAESGRGLEIARALADEVEYERDGPVNRWLVTRARLIGP